MTMPESAFSYNSKPRNYVTNAIVMLAFIGMTPITFLSLMVLQAQVDPDGVLARKSGEFTPYMGLCLIVTGLLALSGYIAYLVLMYRMWTLVQDEHTKVEPGPGVALLAIPLVNLVGIFMVFCPLAGVLNRHLAKHGSTTRVSSGLAMGAGVCQVIGAAFGWVPLLGCLAAPVGLVGTILWIVSVFQMAGAANTIERLAAFQAQGGFGSGEAPQM